ncbi:uncharacterized protein LOC126906796 isoform X2 [Daktulosphaira vitifoliae]|uniref:uncharacterized protein LOC126906796 isoform X2 n=1 Tax=Daktulosphaira vitifoliae TaxID=58002 RepID=UPI0021A97845|nr:uncharacterized protein LOC126906796 isoform X2 [Daktulosphaira vitifoliae]
MSNEITNDKNINIHSLSKVITSNDTSSFRKAAIINSICKYDGWKHLTDIDIVKYGNIIYKLDNINIIANRDTSNKKVRAAALILGCTYANDLKKIFDMVILYCNICRDAFNDKDNIYKYTIYILSITKKITLLATVMKESLILLDSLYSIPLDGTTNDYILYGYLSLLQKVDISSVPLKNSPSSCLGILSEIIWIFDICNSNINNEMENKLKRCIIFEENRSNAILQKLMIFINLNSQNDKNTLMESLNKKLNNEIKKIIIEKFYNLGFYFNTDIKMIDVLVPDEVINNKQMIPKYSNLPYYINIVNEW